MSILDYVILGACGIALASVFGYAFWIKARVLGLRADVLTILAELERRAAELGIPDDTALRFVREKLIGLMEAADSLSFSTLAYTLSCESAKKTTPAEPWPQSTDQKLQAAIDRARKSAKGRIVHYIIHDTLAGGLAWLMMRALPRSLAKKDVRAGAEASMDRLPAIRKHFHAASC